MRDIKFRFWDKTLNKMIFRNLEKYDIAHPEIEVMQFIGLKDRNGNEIFEGDLLKAGDDKVMKVKWNQKFACFCLVNEDWVFAHYFGESCDPDDCEIIGNIHDNPPKNPNISPKQQ